MVLLNQFRGLVIAILISISSFRVLADLSCVVFAVNTLLFVQLVTPVVPVSRLRYSTSESHTVWNGASEPNPCFSNSDFAKYFFVSSSGSLIMCSVCSKCSPFLHIFIPLSRIRYYTPESHTVWNCASEPVP